MHAYVHAPAYACPHVQTDCVQYLFWPLLWAFSPRPQFISNWPQQPHSLNINRLLVNNWLMIWGDLQQHSDNKSAWMGGGERAESMHSLTHSLTRSLTHSLALYLINSHSCFSECRQTVHATIFNDIFGGRSRWRIDSLPHLEWGEEEDLKNNVTTSVLLQIPINLSFGADDSSLFFSQPVDAVSHFRQKPNPIS